MTIADDVTLPLALEAGGGVLAQARPIPGDWTRGVEFAQSACLIAGSHQFCPSEVSPSEKSFHGTAVAKFVPIGIETSVQCTTLRSFDERLPKARRALDIKAEFEVASELATGDVTGAGTGTANPSLADAVSVGSAAFSKDALAILEASIANNLRGELAWIHVAPQRLTELLAERAIWRDELNDVWRTATGNIVVSSPGYATPLEDELVATPEVFASVSDVEQIRTVDDSDNRDMAVYEAAGLAVFDPCFLVSVQLLLSP